MQADASPFTQWALPKLRPLLEARLKDARLGRADSPHFNRVLQFYLIDLNEQPFAQPGDSDAADSPSFNHLRSHAAAYFRIHSNPSNHVRLNAYERAGNVSEDSPLDGFASPELWASTEPALVRELTCVALGIPATTPNSLLPNNFSVRRKFVIKREFSALSAAERNDWHALARERKRSSARGETDFIAVQESQAFMPAWLARTVLEKLSREVLGNIVIQWNGYYVGRHDNGLRRFHGQVATYSPCPQWYGSPEYVSSVQQAWNSFVAKEVEGSVIGSLAELPPGVAGARLPEFRRGLKTFLEELFRLACGLPHLSQAVFWNIVAARPQEFVASYRLPDGVTFALPTHMPEHEFRALYAHVKLSFDGSDTVDSASRFVYDGDIINLFLGYLDAQDLKARWDAKRREAADAVPTATDSSSEAH